MSTKLTLSLNKKVIEDAKAYAKANNISLSFLIENYLQKLITDYGFNKQDKGGLVDEISGIITLEGDCDYEQEHSNYLNEKYK